MLAWPTNRFGAVVETLKNSGQLVRLQSTEIIEIIIRGETCKHLKTRREKRDMIAVVSILLGLKCKAVLRGVECKAGW
jgi:hypothetical protein